MARIRSLKPEFWGSPSHRGADPWVRLFYEAMWGWADDSGRGTANPRELAAFAFPDDEDDVVPGVEDIPRLFLEVAQRYGVEFYKANGRRYYAITTWEKHQRVERRAGSKHPAPEGGTPYDPGPGDGVSFTEYRKFRHRAPEAPASSTGRPMRSPERTNGRPAAPQRANGPRSDLDTPPETAPEQGIPEVPVHDAGARTSRTGSSCAVVGNLEQGIRETAPTERAADAAPHEQAQRTLLDEFDPDDEPARTELALVPDAVVSPSSTPRTPNQRANDLATTYYEAVKKRTNFVAARQTIVVFLDDEWSDEQIREALLKLVADGWGLSKESLRRALIGPPRRSSSKPSASDRAARTLALMRPEGSHAS